MSQLRVGLITKEWPPFVYGGAGVHAVQITSALRSFGDIQVDVHCFGGPRIDGSVGYDTPEEFKATNPALQALATDMLIAHNLGEVDVVHSHTWYANMAGHTASLLYDMPHIVSAHSLEPLRPWKADQLGGGYQISSWAEKTAYESAAAIIAVSNGMRKDVLSSYPDIDPAKVVTIRNGVDTNQWQPMSDPSIAKKYGISGRYAIFVGRITRQKGLAHLLRAWAHVPDEYGLVLCAGSADEVGIGAEFEELVRELQARRENVWWIKEMLPQPELIPLLTGADLFLCPSIYEPLGIVNLEAMACEVAVLASRVGGIPEVVADGSTGKLIDYTPESAEFESRLAGGISEMMSDPDKLRLMGIAGRKRAITEFGWEAVARATISLYRSVLS